jgi:CYTH domain-containing protein
VIERERRFLVAEIPTDLPSANRIQQGYLTVEPVAVRVRRIDDRRHVLTIKVGTGRARTEIERDLDPDEFEALWEQTLAVRLEKRRHRIPLDGQLTAELDLYDGALSGRSLVEVEFDDDEAADTFAPPPWFGREVTEDRRYDNAALARHGWPDD